MHNFLKFCIFFNIKWLIIFVFLLNKKPNFYLFVSSCNKLKQICCCFSRIMLYPVPPSNKSPSSPWTQRRDVTLKAHYYQHNNAPQKIQEHNIHMRVKNMVKAKEKNVGTQIMLITRRGETQPSKTSSMRVTRETCIICGR